MQQLTRIMINIHSQTVLAKKRKCSVGIRHHLPKFNSYL